MFRTKLRNQFLKKRTLLARTKYKKQRNIFVNLVKKAKRNYYENSDLKDTNDNKKFWATAKCLFSNKIKSAKTFCFRWIRVIIRNEVKADNVFNKYFVNMVPSISITNSDTSDIPWKWLCRQIQKSSQHNLY